MAGFDFGFLLGGPIGGVGAGSSGFSGTTIQATEQAKLSLAQTLALTGGELAGLEIFGSPEFLAATGQSLADLEAEAIATIEARQEALFFGVPTTPVFLPGPRLEFPWPTPNGADPAPQPEPLFDLAPELVAFRAPEETTLGGASIFTSEDLNPFLDVLIHATQPRSGQPKPGRAGVLTAAALAIILEILRRLNTKRAQDRNKRAAESILAQQQTQIDSYLSRLRALFGAQSQQGGQPVAFDVGGFFGGVRDVLATPGNLPALLQAFGAAPPPTVFTGGGIQLPQIGSAPRFVQTRPVSNPLEQLAEAFGFNGEEGLNGGGGMFELSPVTGRMRPRNKLQRLSGGKVFTWLRAEPKGWTIVGAGSASVSKRRHHHHHHHRPH